ncbi:MAG: glutamate--tRNA ligase [Candidatus Theseobacter exili]|nr:glutamate--tRNA ligase [Candidatus Theseobacter exili]
MNNVKDPVVVRFAPSPTGMLHVGNARTALFNWLFAKSTGGRFILRIEDTDCDRSTSEYTKMILDNIRWLGLSWDEGPGKGGDNGPYLQSERLVSYREKAEILIKEKKAYRCYCTQEELEIRKQEAVSQGKQPIYDGKCRNLTAEDIQKHDEKGSGYTVRFIVEPQELIVEDLIRGQVRFDLSLYGDFIIMKSNGYPSFHFAVALDDALMGVTHVIRGEDHLPNTPRHMLLFRSFGVITPQFGHLSMILGPDGQRLSKRHGVTSVDEYRQKGYPPQALVNYLALLGWSPGDGQELFSVEELINKFSLKGISKSASIFDPQKLDWVSSNYIHKEDPSDIAIHSIPFLQDAGIDYVDEDYVVKAMAVLKLSLITYSDVVQKGSFFWNKEYEFNDEAIEVLERCEVGKFIEVLLVNLKDWVEGSMPGEAVRNASLASGIKGKEIYHGIRAAITGMVSGPDLAGIVNTLGPERVQKRLKCVLQKFWMADKNES